MSQSRRQQHSGAMASQNSAIARYWPAANLGAFVVVCSGYWLKKLKDHVAEPYMVG